MINERYYSHLRNVTIPLYGFKHFHHASSGEDKVEDFIGRSSITDKLSAWLKDTSSKYSGAYLITGYRGMGKSSFVYEAIQKLKKDEKTRSKDKFTKKARYITVAVNVGNELLSAKELLGMICKVGYANFEKATKGWHWFASRLNSILVAILIIAVAIMSAMLAHGPFRHITQGSCGIVVLTCGYLANALLYFLWKKFGWKYFITTSQTKRTWRSLLQRIDAECLLSSEMSTARESIAKGLVKGVNFNMGFRKELRYPIADVPEMQEIMVRLLNLINDHPYTRLRFIFVIDELDKISPKDDEKQIMPEYEVLSEGKDTNTIARSRQNALASLMANMKYFISSSKAKFVFITGYDMYEATLSDISNREFNIHSIFSGHINVSSFFRHTEKYNGVDSMIEEYLCNLLMGGQNRKTRKSLKDYVKYVQDSWNGIDDKTCGEYQRLLERRIVFLRGFLTYLIYMSNGSPKKLAMYIEKFVRTRDKIEAKMKSESWNVSDDYLLGMPPSDYYLYFDNRNIQRICFVDYLIYPMIQNLVDKSNIYNDKLLVSTSFMLSNLYKCHKSGFSMRNLEYMPELLDIYKMPELRDFIGGIVNFLTQTHVDEANINLYKYKFPLRLSEEITFYSKTSEEISYLFNFSHDELLSVKKLYMCQIKHYSNNKFGEASPIASLHHMMGDIYMLEEDYELAIYEFQEALSALNRQAKNPKDKSNLLFQIRLTLKLGLAYEKRKTYDTAYLTYEHLTATLLKEAKEINQNILPFYSLSFCPAKKIDSGYYLFRNIRIIHLAPLAKLHVLEKMDLGGFTDKDICQISDEANILIETSTEKTRVVSRIDFYTKLGDIMYYRNRNGKNKYYDASFWYDKAISICIDYINRNGIAHIDIIYGQSLSLLKWLLTGSNHKSADIIKPAMIRCLVNSLVGSANYYLGHPQKQLPNEEDIHLFFHTLEELANIIGGGTKDTSEETITKSIASLKGIISNTMEAMLFYWDCAIMYEDIDEYKSAHCIYVQMLDAVYTVLSTNDIKADESVIQFCKHLAIKSIQNSYKHYGHINIAEIDKIKNILNRKYIEDINLDYLSNNSDIEIVLYKYYMVCFLSKNEHTIYETLRNVVNSRQLGGDKIINSVTQDVQNLYFKEHVNRQILFLLIPEIKLAFEKGIHDICTTLSIIDTYLYNVHNFEKVIKGLNWKIFDANKGNQADITDPHFALLEYLVTDSLFCLNKITDILSPLYSTALYNNSFIGECYEKGSIWNHILLVLREILYCPKTSDTMKIEEFASGFIRRYKLHKEKHEIAVLLSHVIKHLGCLLDSNTDEDEAIQKRIENLYTIISPSGHRFLISSYLIGSALDYYYKAVDMHHGGKAYKEMMTTLYLLEDDLHNDSCYLNFATEMYCIDKGYIDRKIQNLKRLYCGTKSLIEITNYINE